MKRAILYFVAFVLLITVVPKFLVARGEIELLTASEQSALDAELQRISDQYDINVVIQTIDQPQNGSISRTAQALYEKIHGDEDGIMLLIATETRDWDIGAHGRGEKIFFTAAREYIGEQILDDLSAGDLYDAYCLFAELCEDFMQKAEMGTPYTQFELPDKPLPDYFVLIAIGAGVAIALIVVLSLKAQLKTVAPKASAADYVRRGSLKIHKSRDVFLYHKVTSHTRSNNSGGRRSGGMSSRGNHTSGKF